MVTIMDKRRAAWGIGAALLLLLAVRHPSADIRIETHAPSDLAPHKVQAALDIGMMAVSVLVTWSAVAPR